MTFTSPSGAVETATPTSDLNHLKMMIMVKAYSRVGTYDCQVTKH